VAVELERTVTAIGLVAVGGGSCRSDRRWPGNESPCAWTSSWSTSSPTAGSGARCPHRSTPPPGVSSRGQTQVSGQRIHVGLPHAGKIVTIEIADDRFNIYDQHETMLCLVPRATTKEATRYKAYGHKAIGA
jgi:hypothetical protein